MKFGDYLRQKREQKSWTQPEAAAKVDIEQSYLSKLETGKSYPSEDIFNRLVGAYQFDPADMSRQIFSEELDKLREIKEVRTVVLERQKSELKSVRGWLVAGLVFLMLGGASLGLSLLGTGDQMKYHYQSMGILKAGENLTAFDIVYTPYSNAPSTDPEYITFRAKQQEMTDRISQMDVYSTTNRGPSFVENIDTENGKRFYRFKDERFVRTVSELKWFIVPAIMFFLGSFGCFFISKRWK